MKKRPIEFRFFCPPAKGFIENYNYKGSVDDLFNDEDPLLIPSQYTGEYDFHGKKIWEGDILEIQRSKNSLVYKAVVEFTEGAFLAKFLNATGTLGWFWLYHLSEQEDVKVVGNRWENPELL